MSLWDEIEIDEKQPNNARQNNFDDKEYKNSLITDLTKHSIINNSINDLFKKISTNIKNVPKEQKETLLEIFTQNSNLINSSNIYLKNPIKSMKLISNILKQSNKKNRSVIQENFENLDSFIKNDFIEVLNEVPITDRTKLVNNLQSIRDDLFEDIKFSEIANKTNIGIGGSFSAGKSSFLNSILDKNIDFNEILPVDSVPTTSVPTYIIGKDEKLKNNNTEIYIFDKDGNKSKIDRESLLAISHEFNKIYDFGLTTIIKKIVISKPDMPYANISFLDTPGYSKSDGEKNTDKNIAKEHLKNIDSLIWLIDADNGIIRDGDIKFIKDLQSNVDILFILNKADKKPLADIKNIIKAIKDTLNKENINFFDVVAYSSHDKKEYFNTNIINNFLKNKNITKSIDYETRFVSVLDQYHNNLIDSKNENSKLLMLLNQIDLLFDTNALPDNFHDILKYTKKETDIVENNYKKYLVIRTNLIEMAQNIDSNFDGKEKLYRYKAKKIKAKKIIVKSKEKVIHKDSSIDDLIHRHIDIPECEFKNNNRTSKNWKAKKIVTKLLFFIPVLLIIIFTTIIYNTNYKKSNDVKITIPKTIPSIKNKQSKDKIVEFKNSNIATFPKNTSAKLTIKTTPADARVRIMNIKPIYHHGILLKKGKFRIRVTKAGYHTLDRWISLKRNEVITVILKKIKDNKDEKYQYNYRKF